MTTKPKPRTIEILEDAARPVLSDLPYRTVIFARNHGQTPLYWVAGVADDPCGAEKALRRSFLKHGGSCFYCKKQITESEMTIDHVECKASGGTGSIQNLLIAHKSCNVAKGNKPIEAYKQEVGREWLESLLKQVQDRLNRLH